MFKPRVNLQYNDGRQRAKATICRQIDHLMSRRESILSGPPHDIALLAEVRDLLDKIKMMDQSVISYQVRNLRNNITHASFWLDDLQVRQGALLEFFDLCLPSLRNTFSDNPVPQVPLNIEHSLLAQCTNGWRYNGLEINQHREAYLQYAKNQNQACRLYADNGQPDFIMAANFCFEHAVDAIASLEETKSCSFAELGDQATLKTLNQSRDSSAHNISLLTTERLKELSGRLEGPLQNITLMASQANAGLAKLDNALDIIDNANGAASAVAAPAPLNVFPLCHSREQQQAFLRARQYPQQQLQLQQQQAQFQYAQQQQQQAQQQYQQHLQQQQLQQQLYQPPPHGPYAPQPAPGYLQQLQQWGQQQPQQQLGAAVPYYQAHPQLQLHQPQPQQQPPFYNPYAHNPHQGPPPSPSPPPVPPPPEMGTLNSSLSSLKLTPGESFQDALSSMGQPQVSPDFHASSSSSAVVSPLQDAPRLSSSSVSTEEATARLRQTEAARDSVTAAGLYRAKHEVILDKKVAAVLQGPSNSFRP